MYLKIYIKTYLVQLSPPNLCILWNVSPTLQPGRVKRPAHNMYHTEIPPHSATAYFLYPIPLVQSVCFHVSDLQWATKINNFEFSHTKLFSDIFFQQLYIQESPPPPVTFGRLYGNWNIKLFMYICT